MEQRNALRAGHFGVTERSSLGAPASRLSRGRVHDPHRFGASKAPEPYQHGSHLEPRQFQEELRWSPRGAGRHAVHERRRLHTGIHGQTGSTLRRDRPGGLLTATGCTMHRWLENLVDCVLADPNPAVDFEVNGAVH